MRRHAVHSSGGSNEPWPGHRGRGGKRRSWAAGTITNGASGVRKRRGGCCGPRATHASVVWGNGVVGDSGWLSTMSTFSRNSPPKSAPAALSGSFPHFCPFAGPSCSDKNTQQQLCVPTKWYHSGQYMLWGHRRYHHNTTQRLLYTTHVMNLHFTLMRLARIWAMEAGVGPIPQR